jgi:hypothetical protein
MEAQKIIFLVFPNMDNVSVAQVTLALWSSAFVAGAKSVTAQRTRIGKVFGVVPNNDPLFGSEQRSPRRRLHHDEDESRGQLRTASGSRCIPAFLVFVIRFRGNMRWHALTGEAESRTVPNLSGTARVKV